MEGERVSALFTHIRPRTCLVWLVSGLIGWSLLGLTAEHSCAQEAQWIWSPAHKKEEVPQGAAYFRKSFTMKAPGAGQITILADDMYEIYVNGKRVGNGETTKNLSEYDISRFLQRGRNTVAVKVTNRNGNTAALAARVLVQENKKWLSHSTDKTWVVSLTTLPLWNSSVYNDARWDRAQVFGRLGDTAPWDLEEGVASEERHKSGRFQINDEFEVQRVVDPDDTGSLISMAFNEFGHILAAREGGPLLLIYDSQRDGKLDKVRVYCDQVKNCQGILALNGEVFVTGDGPDGSALYRLADADRDGTLESVKTVLKFQGTSGEHGPHAITLGPDGLIYINVGNHSSSAKEYDADSPYKNYYEGDVVPRYEDPGGHAVGVKAPGGSILRTDTDGTVVQLYAGGLRNSYDLLFNSEGELFAHESDMETEEGAPWYRPTQLHHLLPGGEYGWRSGWSWWPEYFVDVTPSITDTGRGSPTGGVVYDHFMFPSRYHGAMFLADWSEGRILAVKTKRSGASYTATSEVFLSGNPLNVTDVEIGPDGYLYFITGGRGTSGGVYRVTWKGKVPEAISNLGTGISAAIRQPQMHSAWSRQKIAAIKRSMGQEWEAAVVGVAISSSNPPPYRTRAMDLMHLFGPVPSSDLLVRLSREKSEIVRAKAADLMGIHADDATQKRLIEMFDDGDRNVRRKACEALVRAGQSAPADKVLELVKSDDRMLAFSARRLLERLPVAEWRELVLETKDPRILIQGGLALSIAHPSRENSLAVTEKIHAAMQEFVSDQDFVDMLRVVQVAIARGELKADDLPELKTLLTEEFPAGNAVMNRELVRLLAALQATDIMDRYMDYLKSDAENVEKLHLAMHLRYLETGWKPEQKLELIKFYEVAQKQKGAQAYAPFVQAVARDFAKTLNEEEARLVLAKGAEWPAAALGALYKLPKEIDDETFANLKTMDQAVAANLDDASVKLKVGIVAVLARSGREDAFVYLREVYDRDPERRAAVTIGLAQQPDETNWPYLVKSLPILEGPLAVEVLKRLTTVDQLPEDPEPYRQVILRGLLLQDKGGEQAIKLLEWWTGEAVGAADDDVAKKLTAWQDWYAAKYPDRPAAVLPTPAEGTKWQLTELMTHLGSEEGRTGSLERGSEVFAKAQCVKCHRKGDIGDRLGPDLTSVSKRFMKKEILESILFPSHVVSDQWSAKTVVTTDGKSLTGVVSPGAAGETIILLATGEKVTVKESDIESTTVSKLSAMPEGLLNELTLTEISDLMAYLGMIPPASLAEKPVDVVAPKR
ncbi:MAG TPA: HEAT repeat domain-containing protein [Pirellulaceae bacterium]|nr:HEAT repeat domain-containing protein [Pirellulaceae bacterium]